MGFRGIARYPVNSPSYNPAECPCCNRLLCDNWGGGGRACLDSDPGPELRVGMEIQYKKEKSYGDKKWEEQQKTAKNAKEMAIDY